MKYRGMKFLTGFLMLVTVVLFFSSCDKARVMEDNQAVNGDKWAYDDPKTFTVDIQDTTLHYNIYINVRHSFQFEWRNVWVNVETVLPDGKKFEKRVNLILSEADGRWFAKCTGDNCYLPIPMQMGAHFPQLGKYTFKITQDMRVSPLNNIKAIGMRVEKAGVK